MSLTTYSRKRNFSKTPEPKGIVKSSAQQLSFVVQKHDATNLHYDFRLELDGVLKSWAVPKGPSLNPADKRLAIMVEDHPLSYGKFEGTIPDGNYGAGTVEIWDKGTYTSDPDTITNVTTFLRKGLTSGSLKFTMHGSKLRGSFALVRLKSGKGNNWLLIKHRDEFAIDEYDISSTRVDRKPISKKTAEVLSKPRKMKKAKKSPARKTGENTGQTIKANGQNVKLTNQQKVYWPEDGYTKGDVIKYYSEVSSHILPYLKNRPQSLKRNPDGIISKGFFHKDAGNDAPDWVKHVAIRAESTNKNVEYILCNNKATLLYLNNLGCIEINPWNSRVTKLDRPDYMIIDIDPSDSNSFDEVVDAALVIKEVLDKAEATCYCKTSGATGIHIYVPLHAAYTYDEVRPFAELVATISAEQMPKVATIERSLKKRGNRIYIDYLQNSRGQTLAAPYSVRPVPGATVSAPLLWKEVKHGLTPQQFTLKTMRKRLADKGDLFKGVLKEKNNLIKCLKKVQSS